jgi:Lrp/AsnC family transcriptional regulator for asnA, asnC and gidA
MGFECRRFYLNAVNKLNIWLKFKKSTQLWGIKMIDEVDKKLIEALHKEGRESYTELAAKLNVVEGTVRKRVKHLIREKIIEIVAIPNLVKLGYSLMSIMGLQVRLSELRNVADKLAKNPHVCYLAFVTGRYDLMAVVVTRTHQELSDFIEKEISAIHSISRTETFVNLDVIKGKSFGIDISQLIANLDISRFK